MWNIYHPEGTFTTTEEKATFVTDINDYYGGTGGFPEFYVCVHFITMPGTSMFRGRQPVAELDKPFIRLAISHIHVNQSAISSKLGIEDPAARIRGAIDTAIKRSITDKGYYVEYSVSEDPRELWKVDGLLPPPWKSNAEEVWKRENKAVPWEKL